MKKNLLFLLTLVCGLTNQSVHAMTFCERLRAEQVHEMQVRNDRLQNSVQYLDSVHVRQALNMGADVNMRCRIMVGQENNEGKTLLYVLAGRSCSAEDHSRRGPNARLLLQARANPDAGYRDKTPLHEAVSNGQFGVAHALVDAGANINAQGTGRDAGTPLFEAVSHYNMAAMRWLLEQGAKPNIRSNTGYTPLHHSIYKASPYDYATEMTRRLYSDQYPRIDWNDARSIVDGYPGIKDEPVEFAEMLIVYDKLHSIADPNYISACVIRDNAGRTPYEMATQMGREKLKNLLEYPERTYMRAREKFGISEHAYRAARQRLDITGIRPPQALTLDQCCIVPGRSVGDDLTAGGAVGATVGGVIGGPPGAIALGTICAAGAAVGGVIGRNCSIQ